MTTLIQKQRELFNKRFPFVSSDILQEVTSFFTTCLIEHYEEDIRKLEGMKNEMPYPNANNGWQKELEGEEKSFNSALSLAISLLQDKIKQLKQ